MSDVVISVENLGKRYTIGHERPKDNLRDQITHTVSRWFRRGPAGIPVTEDFWALKEVSFEVRRGDVLGIIGRNGAGKSTLLKILSRITEPTTGRVRIRGRVASLLEVGTGFHPELTGRENVFLNGAILGMSRAEITRKFDEIVTFAEVERFIDTPVKHYSSGMYVRLAFAVAAHLDPEILIIDEVLAVGDMQFQRKCLGKMHEVAAGEGRTVLFVSHNTAAIAQLCTRGLYLEMGKRLCLGTVDACLALYASSANSESGKMVGQVQIIDARLAVDRIDIQGSEARGLHVSSGTEELRIGVELRISETLPASLELQLRDQFGGCLAMFSPGHVDPDRQVLLLSPGSHRLEATVRLPRLHRGRYVLDLAITRPGVIFYAKAPGICILHHEGTVTPSGVVFDQSAQGAGFMLLDGKLTALSLHQTSRSEPRPLTPVRDSVTL